MKKIKQKKRKIQLTPEQKKERAQKAVEKRAHNNFIKKISMVFKMASFCRLNVIDKRFKIGNRVAEVDNVFVFNNIIVICEDTTTSEKHIKDHLIVKKETAMEIENNKQQFIDFLNSEFPNETGDLKAYDIHELRFKFIY